MVFSLSLHQWGQIKSTLLNWFTDPQQILLPLLAIALVTLCLRPFPLRKWIIRSTCALGLAYSLLISPLGATLVTQGLMVFLPAYQGQPADAIIILGRGTLAEQARAATASQLWQAQRAPVILATGRGEAPRLSTLLTELGVPPAVQLIEPQARTTEENAVRSYELLQSIDAKQLILITDQPHMLRSLLTFQSFGFQVTPYPISVPSTLPSIEKTALALREYVGLAGYALVGRFQPRSTEVADLSEASRPSP